MLEAGPSPLPDHPWQLKQIPLPSYSRFPSRMISAEASLEYPSKGEVTILAVPRSCAGTRGSKGAFSPLRLYVGKEGTSVDFVAEGNEHAVRMSASTKRSGRRTNVGLAKVMRNVEVNTFLLYQNL